MKHPYFTSLLIAACSTPLTLGYFLFKYVFAYLLFDQQVGQESAATSLTAQGHPTVLAVESVTRLLAPPHSARTVLEGGWAPPAMTVVCTVILKAVFANVTLASPGVDARANVQAKVNV